ncbi:MAG: PadR family transcriptional regulator [Acidobacteria bacterium]|nr:PadR family transcriptional regulator [Acidobacteriota bacterium]
MAHDYLGEFEHLVLLAVIRLDSEAYGAPIRRLIAERAERDVSFGAVYSTLRRLEAKGYIGFTVEPSTSPEGGRPRRIAHLTESGQQAVDAARRRLERMSDSLSERIPVGPN